MRLIFEIFMHSNMVLCYYIWVIICLNRWVPWDRTCFLPKKNPQKVLFFTLFKICNFLPNSGADCISFILRLFSLKMAFSFEMFEFGWIFAPVAFIAFQQLRKKLSYLIRQRDFHIFFWDAVYWSGLSITELFILFGRLYI